MGAKRKASYPDVSARQSPRGLVAGHRIPPMIPAGVLPGKQQSRRGTQMSDASAHTPPFHTWLAAPALLTLAAEVEASWLDGYDARAELRRRLNEMRARWRRHWIAEWAPGSVD